MTSLVISVDHFVYYSMSTPLCYMITLPFLICTFLFITYVIHPNMLIFCHISLLITSWHVIYSFLLILYPCLYCVDLDDIPMLLYDCVLHKYPFLLLDCMLLIYVGHTCIPFISNSLVSIDLVSFDCVFDRRVVTPCVLFDLASD